MIALTTYLFDTVLDGRNSNLTDGIERALGREPLDFSDYARDAAAAGVWNTDGNRSGNRRETRALIGTTLMRYNFRRWVNLDYS